MSRAYELEARADLLAQQFDEGIRVGQLDGAVGQLRTRGGGMRGRARERAPCEGARGHTSKARAPWKG
eukprot:3305186-Prymnesium_polylepis.1